MINVISQRLMKYSLRTGNRFASKLPFRRTFYFAFGANMNPEWLKRNNINPSESTSASLENFQLRINAPCESLGKGFASVVPKDGEHVYGILHEISDYELRILDALEWRSFNFYHRRKTLVKKSDGELVEAWYYVAAAPKEGLQTSPFYKNLLVKAARSNDFPEEYIKYLSELPTAEEFELDHGFRLSNPAKRRFFEKELKSIYRTHDLWREKLCQLLP